MVNPTVEAIEMSAAIADLPPTQIPPTNFQLRIKQRIRRTRQSTQQRIESLAGELLAIHPHFRGRSRFVEFRCDGHCLTLGGCLPSYYLKQLAQEAIRSIRESFDELEIDNQIIVCSPVGAIAPSANDANDVGLLDNHGRDNRVEIEEVKNVSSIKRIPR